MIFNCDDCPLGENAVNSITCIRLSSAESTRDSSGTRRLAGYTCIYSTTRNRKTPSGETLSCVSLPDYRKESTCGGIRRTKAGPPFLRLFGTVRTHQFAWLFAEKDWDLMRDASDSTKTVDCWASTCTLKICVIFHTHVWCRYVRNFSEHNVFMRHSADSCGI